MFFRFESSPPPPPPTGFSLSVQVSGVKLQILTINYAGDELHVCSCFACFLFLAVSSSSSSSSSSFEY